MIARIKFSGSGEDNTLSVDQHQELEDFLGEKLEVSALRVDENGNEKTFFAYSETFDPEEAKNSDKELVFKSENVRISDSKDFLVDLDLFLAKYPFLAFNIRGIPKSITPNYNDVTHMMNEVGKKIETVNERFSKAIEFNSKCDVHVPNLGLLNINKVAYANDYCTEELGEKLSKGWRIIAVCPQPDQRRPDYILGMSVSDLYSDENVSVERFESCRRDE